ncbi:MAG TPA: FtsX-like permease family protein [Pirellulaceae bacterium]|nr:FtsX-like permease family protein [Pirellulaceae bacterium]
MIAAIPLAWKNLTNDVRKLLVAVSGVCFAVMLMFQQRGFNNALFDSTVELVRQMDADLIVHSQARFALSSEMRFDRLLMDMVATRPGVASAHPVYIEHSLAQLRRSGLKSRPIRVVGVDLRQQVLLDHDGAIERALLDLDRPGTAIMDRLSKENYGFDLTPDRSAVEVGELCGKEISIVGLCTISRDFAHNGNLVMSTENFAHYFPFRAPDPLGIVDVGLIRSAPGTDLNQLRQDLSLFLPDSVRVVLRSDFIKDEIAFWYRSTPIGTIFLVGSIMGFVVGVIICYQVLANNIGDHIRELATLKAMGYTNRYFVRLVFSQSLFLAVLGFVPGLVLSLFLYQFYSAATGLLMVLTWPRVAFIFVLTLGMCCVSGLFALRKLLAADPASLF